MHIRGKETSGIYALGKVITAAYVGAVLVWEALKSCFGRGYWIDQAPWVDEEGWRNE